MTITLGLNENNDLYLGSDGNLVVLSGIEAVAAACLTISKTILGEMVLTTTQGLPDFQAVWVGVPNLKVWESYLRRSLQNVSGVIDVISIKVAKENDTLFYTATIRTQFGITTING